MTAKQTEIWSLKNLRFVGAILTQWQFLKKGNAVAQW